MTIVFYLHGKGGNAAESEHYKPLFPNCEVIGVDYRSETPWEAGPEIRTIVQDLSGGYDDIILIANSIGAFFSLHAEIGGLVREAFFISPVVDLEKVNGVELHGVWLDFVRSHPVQWDVPTHILYGSRDSLIPLETIREFAGHHNATLTVMEAGEHWFHTEEQMLFLDNWIREHRYSFITLRDRPEPKNTVRVERAILDITQQQLADAIGVSRNTINSIESGRYVPSTVLALKIARYFGKPADSIFTLEEGD